MEAIEKKVTGNRMGTEPVGKLLIKMSLPMMMSMFILALYNIVDSMFVSSIENALTAVSLAFPFQMLVTGFAVGTSVGTSSLIARKLGEKNHEYANQTASIGLVLSLITGIVFTVIYLFLSEKLMALFTDDPDTLKKATEYLTICGIFAPVIMISVACEKILQGTGNMIHPMLTQLAGAVVNIAFDPLFIFGYHGFPKLGISGAAVATVLGQAVSMLVGIYFLFFYKKNNILKLSFKKFKFDLGVIGQIYNVGIASILMQSIASFATIALNTILIRFFSQVAVDVLGVYFKIQSFIFMPVFGLNSGALPILGYNFGARQKDRFTRTLKLGVLFALGIMLVGLAVFQFLPQALLSLFHPSAEMLAIGTKAFRTISICFPFAAFGIMLVCTFNAVGKGIYSLIVSVLRQVVIIIPAAYIFAKYFGIDAVWLAYPLAEGIGMIAAVSFFIRVYKQLIEPLDSNNCKPQAEEASENN